MGWGTKTTGWLTLFPAQVLASGRCQHRRGGQKRYHWGVSLAKGLRAPAFTKSKTGRKQQKKGFSPYKLEESML